MPDDLTETGFTQRITKEYYNLTAAEKKVADYVIAHRAEVQNLSITELAGDAAVAEATVSRFVRRLQYRGYNEFRMDLARSAMASATAARLCPQAIWTSGNYARYREMSAKVMSFIDDETPLTKEERKAQKKAAKEAEKAKKAEAAKKRKVERALEKKK